MAASSIPAASIPAHVPPELVRDVDLYNLPGANEDVHLAWKRVQDENPDIFYTPRYGGYWVVTRAALLERIWPDHERFSSRHIAIPRGEEEQQQLPIEADPPSHRYYRAPLNMALSPKAVRLLAERARGIAAQLIEGIKPRGECEFVHEFASHLPMEVFLSIVDLPSKDREWLIARTQIMTRGGDVAARQAALQEVFGYLHGWIEQRRAQPAEDLISRIVQIQIDGRPISHQEALSECALVLFGGLDTVAGTMAFIMRFLALNPQHRRRLVSEPALIPHAIEELLRRHSIPTISRVLTEDVTIGGVTMKVGDHVQLTTVLHSLDERRWADPLEVDFARHTHDIMSFGQGVHKCPGSNLARSEIRVLLEEWLQRIPEFSIKPGEQPVTATGAVAGVLSLPLVWPVG
ncbi:MAG: cytochrome P450 [Steroidobacteraceae bacterium]